MLDPVRNFAKVTVSQGYDSTATQITLVTGDGAKLPDPATEGAFNLVWYNDTDYKDPADDPYVEIVRVTTKSGDTLTIQRGQEGTSAQNHNLSGKTYKMVLGLTKKTMDDIQNLPKRTATLIVAANDSKDKSRADYVCDGVNDQEEINAAINALPTFGGKVLLLEGTYNISASITILKNNVTLEGQGAGTKLFLVNGANSNVIQVGDASTSLERIRIVNLRIDGNKANNTAGTGIDFFGSNNYLITKCSIENCIILNCYTRGIRFYFVNFSKIIGNQIENSGGIGLYLWSSNYNIVRGNVSISNGSENIKLFYSGENLIAQNICNGSSGSYGITVSTSHKNILSGNETNSNVGGFLIDSSNENLIIGNEANSNTLFSGIHLASASYNAIIGNRCTGNSAYGINIFNSACTQNLVVKNYLTNNTSDALYDAGTGTIKGAFVDNDNVPGQREHIQINTQTANYTLVLSDDGKLINMNSSSALTLTVPANSSVAFPIGTRIYVRKGGTGDVTISGATGVTINAPFGNTITTQYQTVVLMKVDTNTWDLLA
jgi:parallel beta-helix repeat protein